MQDKKTLAKEVPILQVAKLVPLTLIKRGSYYSFKEHDSCVIDPQKNKFWHNSQNVSGDQIDLLKHFCNYSFSEAIDAILNSTAIPDFVDFNKNTKTEKKKFSVPDIAVSKEGELYTEDVENYLLNKRKISPSAVNYMVKSGRLCQQSIRQKGFTRGKFRSCCLFIGYENGKTNQKPVFCERRTIFPENKKSPKKTLTVPGSDWKHGYYINNEKPTLIVTEGILDFMAIMSIIEKNNQDYMGFDYLALIGVNKTSALKNILKEQPHIKNVIISLDNDEAGEIAAKEILKILKEDFPAIGSVNHPCNQKFKDYNDYLISIA